MPLHYSLTKYNSQIFIYSATKASFIIMWNISLEDKTDITQELKYIALLILTIKVRCTGIGQLNTTRLLLEVNNPTYHKKTYKDVTNFIITSHMPFLTWVLQESSRGKEHALCRSAQIKGKNFRMFSPELSARKELPHKYKCTFLQVKLFWPFQSWRCLYPASHQEHKFCFPAHIFCDLQWKMWHWNKLSFSFIRPSCEGCAVRAF